MPPRTRIVSAVLSAALPVAAAVMVLGAGPAEASCASGDPCVTKLVPVPTTRTHGGQFMLRIHWSSACKYDKFHFSMNRSSFSPTEIGTNRNQLCNQRSHTFLIGSSQRGSRVTVRVQGCESRLVGKDKCTRFSAPMTVTLVTPQHAAACRNYANRAVGAVRLARFTYRCDRKVISGPRWSMNFEEHRAWCETAEPKTANFEDKERTRIMHECRVKVAMPQGKPTISVSSRGGDTFIVSGTGFLPNVPVIIRVSGPGAQPGAITVDMRGNRIVAAANGRLTVTLFGAKVCKRGGGRIDFTAEDQDRPASNRVSSTCAA